MIAHYLIYVIGHPLPPVLPLHCNLYADSIFAYRLVKAGFFYHDKI
jgi:hypothetical protein